MVNPVEAEQVCVRAEQALRQGQGRLHQFPKLLQRVITERLWEERCVPGHGIVRLANLHELLVSKPRKGWGLDEEELPRIEAVIRDDAEVLAMWREEMTPEKHKHHDGHNITISPMRGTNRAYLLDRLKRKAPELYQRVVRKKLSAHAAAIEAGIVKVKTPLEQLAYWWKRASKEERVRFLDKVQ